MRQARHTLTGLATTGVLALFAGCTEPKATEFVAGITTQMQVPKDLRAIGVLIQRDGRAILCKTYPVTGEGYVQLPSTSGVYPESELGKPVTVSIFGYRADPGDFETDCLLAPNQAGVGKGGVVVLRRSRSTFVEKEVLYLPLPLRQACTQVQCPEGQSCKAGLCVEPDVPSEKLEPYREDLVRGDTNTCFQAAACFQDGTSTAARASLSGSQETPLLRVVDKDKCVFEFPQVEGLPAPNGLNVRLVHDNFSTEILDLDPEEGFTIPDATKPLQFQLAPGLCDTLYKKGRIVGMDATPLCQSKTPLQPICTKDLNEIIYGNAEGVPKDASNDAICPSDETLQPAPALLYVLVDRSDGMRALFKDGLIEKTLKIPLESPSLANTRVALKYLPAAASDCGGASNGYASPAAATGDIPFTPAYQVPSVLGQVLATSPVLPDNPPLQLGAALKAGGAYDAFDKWLTTQSPAPVIGRRAVLIIGQRDLAGTCLGGQTPAQRAAAALAAPDPVSTYVLLLKNPDPDAPDAQADAEAIATAGGTTLFDARTNPATISEALFKTTADLGSCLYEAPKSFDINAGKERNKLSYHDLVGLKRVDIDYDGTCGTSPAANGWNIEGTRIRVCGASCTALRDSIANAGLFSSVKAEQTAPAIAMKVSRPCDVVAAESLVEKP